MRTGIECLHISGAAKRREGELHGGGNCEVSVGNMILTKKLAAKHPGAAAYEQICVVYIAVIIVPCGVNSASSANI